MGALPVKIQAKIQAWTQGVGHCFTRQENCLAATDEIIGPKTVDGERTMAFTNIVTNQT